MPEGDRVTSIDLAKEWEKTLAFFDQMISNGQNVRPIRFIIRHIIDKGYSSMLYPGTSLYNLLISFPINNKIDYTKTLKIECDQLRSQVKFNYRDYTGYDRQQPNSLDKALKWKEVCQPTEVIATFEHFLNEFNSGQQKYDIV